MKTNFLYGVLTFCIGINSYLLNGALVTAYDMEDDFTIADLRAKNQQNLGRLERGMTKSQANQIMGNRSSEETFMNGAFIVTNPYKTEIFEMVNQDNIVVDYYLTEYIPPGRGRGFFSEGLLSPKILDQHLTPLVFVNDKLEGWGRKYFIEYKDNNKLKSRKVIYGNP